MRFSTTLGNIQLNTAALSPKATTNVSVTANLDSTATPPTLPWDPQNPGPTSNFTTSIQTYDSLGNPHTLNVYFQDNGGSPSSSWTYHVLANGPEMAPPSPGTTEVATGAAR